VKTDGPGMLSEVTFLATSLRLAVRNLENPLGFLHFRQPAASGHRLLTGPCRGRYIDLVGEAEVSLRSTLSLSERWGPPESDLVDCIASY